MKKSSESLVDSTIAMTRLRELLEARAAQSTAEAAMTQPEFELELHKQIQALKRELLQYDKDKLDASDHHSEGND